jgi:hypothetical protein
MHRPFFALILFCVSCSVSLASADSIEPSNLRKQQEYRQLQSVGTVATLQLINADTNLPIATLTNGTVIDIATFITSKFNIRATTSGVVGSVRFGYNQIGGYRTDSSFPFSLCPSPGTPRGPDYQACTVLAPGQHTVTATPFSSTFLTGMVGTPLRITFTITNTCKKPQVRRGKQTRQYLQRKNVSHSTNTLHFSSTTVP